MMKATYSYIYSSGPYKVSAMERPQEEVRGR